MNNINALKKVAIGLLSFIVIGLVISFYLMGSITFNQSMQLVTNETTSSDHNEYLKKCGLDIDEFTNTYQIERIEIESSLDNHKIPASYILANGEKNNDTVILVHGLGGNRFSVYNIAEIYLKLGYNVIAYDQRSSGENLAKYTTGGYWESHDLLDYINYVDKIVDSDKHIGVWGESYGGATVAIALGDKYANVRLSFAVLDCPMSQMEYMIKSSIEGEGNAYPVDLISYLGNLYTKVKLGISYDDMNAVNYIKDTTVPVLIFNSKADETTPYFMGIDLYNAINSNNKKIYTAENSKHVEIALDHRDDYISKIKAMLP